MQPTNAQQDSLKTQPADRKAISMLDCDNYPQYGKLLQDRASAVSNNRIFIKVIYFHRHTRVLTSTLSLISDGEIHNLHALVVVVFFFPKVWHTAVLTTCNAI